LVLKIYQKATVRFGFENISNDCKLNTNRNVIFQIYTPYRWSITEHW